MVLCVLVFVGMFRCSNVCCFGSVQIILMVILVIELFGVLVECVDYGVGGLGEQWFEGCFDQWFGVIEGQVEGDFVGFFVQCFELLDVMQFGEWFVFQVYFDGSFWY